MHGPGMLIALQDADGRVYLGVVARATPEAAGQLLDVDVIADGVCRATAARSVRVT